MNPILQVHPLLLDGCFLLSIEVCVAFEYRLDRCAADNEDWDSAELDEDNIEYKLDWKNFSLVSAKVALANFKEVPWMNKTQAQSNAGAL